MRRIFTLICLVAVVCICQQIQAQVFLNGTGATFPAPIYTKWFVEYHKIQPGIFFNYQPLGSGAGIKQMTEGTVDFGASDAALTDAQLTEYREKNHSGLLMFPTVASGAVPTYNLPGVPSGLNFTSKALAGIFLGTIKTWNDPELVNVNPAIKLPAAGIIVVHRSEGSGTTFCWTDYLSKISPEWKTRVGTGTAVNWPIGLGAKGNDGVASQVKLTANSIGYVELIYAVKNKIPYGNVRNSSGVFVKPGVRSIMAAASAAVDNIPDDFRISITNSSGAAAYPIATFTWLLVPERIADTTKREAITAFLNWMLNDGQKIAETLAYAPLPSEVIAIETRAIARVR